MTPTSVVRMITAEARYQKIPMTCHRIQLADAVDATEHGEPAEKSCKGSEGIAGKGNWPRCFGNADGDAEGARS
jgi:hypothetical protein